MPRKSPRGTTELRTVRNRETKQTPSQKTLNQTVSIIGAGRLGTALAVALSAKGFTIETVVSRRIQSARRAVRLIGTGTHALSIRQTSAIPSSNILFITTPDDAIESVSAQLAGNIKWNGQGHVALHASGALSSEALASLRDVGFSTGSMHPLLSVSDPRSSSVSFERAHFCIEGQSRAVRVARSVIRSLGGKSFSISTKDKALYHAAAVMSSGHMVALFDIAKELLSRCGLTEKQSRDALVPLLKSTVENLTHNAPTRALTGTFARADVATMLKHLAALNTNDNLEALATYKLLGLRSLQLARKNGADLTSIEKIKSILREQPGNQRRGQQS